MSPLIAKCKLSQKRVPVLTRILVASESNLTLSDIVAGWEASAVHWLLDKHG